MARCVNVSAKEAYLSENKIKNILDKDQDKTALKTVITTFHVSVPKYVLEDVQCLFCNYKKVSGMYEEIPDDILEIYQKLGDDDKLIEKYYSLSEEFNYLYQSEVTKLKSTAIDSNTGLITFDEYLKCKNFLENILPQTSLVDAIIIITLDQVINLKNKELSNKMIEEIKKQRDLPWI